MNTLHIGDTTKGRRIWLQGLERFGWPAGTRYNIVWYQDSILLVRDDVSGKRSVTAGKGGIVDIVSQKVTRWSDGAPYVTVSYSLACITIHRSTSI